MEIASMSIDDELVQSSVELVSSTPLEDIRDMRSILKQCVTELGLDQAQDNGNYHEYSATSIEYQRRALLYRIQHLRDSLRSQWETLTPIETDSATKKSKKITFESCTRIAERISKEKGEGPEHPKVTHFRIVHLLYILSSIANELHLGYEYKEDQREWRMPFGQASLVVLLDEGGVIDAGIERSDTEALPSDDLRSLLMEGEYDTFESIITKAVRTEQLSVLFPQISLPSVLDALRQDLATLHQYDCVEYGNDKNQCERYGHGLTSSSYRGPSLSFYHSPSTSYHASGFISILETSSSQRLSILPHARIENGELKYTSLSGTGEAVSKASTCLSEPLNLSLTLSFASPLVASLSIFSALRQASLQFLSSALVTPVGTRHDQAQLPKRPDESRTAIMNDSDVSRSVSLLSLLAREYRERNGGVVALCPRTKESTVNILGSHYRALVHDQAIPSVRLHQVPFIHSSQILPILRILRQQLVFNELLTSLFTNTTERDEQDTKKAMQLEANYSPPRSLSVLFPHPSGRALACLNIDIKTNGMVSAVIEATPRESLESDEYITKLLQKSLHVPLVLHMMLSRVKA